MYRMFKTQVGIQPKRTPARKKKESKDRDKSKKFNPAAAKQDEQERRDKSPTRTPADQEEKQDSIPESRNRGESDGFDHDEMNDVLGPPIKLTRSMSRDSYSTFTTAAETPSDVSTALSFVWGDLPMPLEIYICDREEAAVDRGKSSSPRIEKLGSSDEGDEKEEDEEEEEEELRFLPRGMLPRERNFRVHPSKSRYCGISAEKAPRRRRNSNGDTDYLDAPARWTRFEI